MKTDISVIVPTYQDERLIHSALDDLFSNHEPNEVIVIDGGSRDRTRALAHEWCPVFLLPKSHAARINFGAHQATGDILLILSPEMRLPSNALRKIRAAILDGAVAGRFSMGFDFFNLINPLRRFFGSEDYCFFIRRDVFERLGTLNEYVPASELDLFKRLRRVAAIVTFEDPVKPFIQNSIDAVAYLLFKLKRLILLALYNVGIYQLFSRSKAVSAPQTPRN